MPDYVKKWIVVVEQIFDPTDPDLQEYKDEAEVQGFIAESVKDGNFEIIGTNYEEYEEVSKVDNQS